MLGFRGASRYIAASFRDCFELECRAMKKVRDEMGLTNVELMVPFVRTVTETKKVIDLLAYNGLKRGHNGLRIVMMCEIPRMRSSPTSSSSISTVSRSVPTT